MTTPMVAGSPQRSPTRSFFAVFSLALLGFAILGSMVDNPRLLATMQERLPQIVPRLDLAGLRDARCQLPLDARAALVLPKFAALDPGGRPQHAAARLKGLCNGSC